MVYWQGGDKAIEDILFQPNAFDRIVVWGSPETVASVQSRALFTRTICLNPRYSVSLIGQEAFSGNLEEIALQASLDVMGHNQKACTASLVNFIEGSEEQANEYAGILCGILNKWDRKMPNFVSPSAVGQIKRLRRGRYASARWYVNNREDDFSSGVVVIPDEFDILNHPMCRLVIVKPVAKPGRCVRTPEPVCFNRRGLPGKAQAGIERQDTGQGCFQCFTIGAKRTFLYRHASRRHAGFKSAGRLEKQLISLSDYLTNMLY